MSEDRAPQAQHPDHRHLEEAQVALDGVSRLHEPSRAGQLEQGFVDTVNTAGQATDSSDGLSILIDGVKTLVESLPPLVRALDTIAQIHPFLAVAVGAFKVVVELEAKRRDNDKKVNLLFLEMRNMMAALLQLQGVRQDHVAQDGLSIGARLEQLVQKTADDIKQCANACDAYARKRLLVKVLKAPSWDGTLKEYIQLFTQRKGEFAFAISIHTGLGIDKANDTLDALVAKMDVVIAFFERTVPREHRALAELIRAAGGQKTVLSNPDVLHELLLREQQLEATALPPSAAEDTARTRPGITGYYYGPTRGVAAGPGGALYSRAAENQRQRRRSSATRGGYRDSYRPSSRTGPGYEYNSPGAGYTYPKSRERGHPYGDFPGERGGKWSPSEHGGGGDEDSSERVELRRLMRDLADEPAVAIRKNLVWFERKFKIQQRELVQEMTAVVVHQGDRVISSVLAGPHERIIDPDMYEIWKDMRWRGIVKGRHLALAIHDYFSQKLDDEQRAAAQGIAPPPRAVSKDDLWALGCLDLMHLRQITEAFDSDASGFVTVQEVNYFTTSRPEGWSLPHWLAYWTVGWQLSMTEYRRKIYALLVRIRDLSQTPSALRGGRTFAVQDYLGTVFPLVTSMTKQFHETAQHEDMLDHFKEYTQHEEARIHDALETSKYDLDALDTLALVNGPLGLERNLFVILYLILRRHLQIMTLGKKVILNLDELQDAAAVVRLVKDAYDFRAQELVGLFTQRRLMVTLEMDDFACGMMSDTPGSIAMVGYYSPRRDTEWDPVVAAAALYNIPSEDPALDEMNAAILKYPPHLEEFYPENEDGVDNEGTSVADELKPLLGRWAGVRTYDIDGHPYRSAFAFDFHISPSNPQEVVAVPLLRFPWRSTRTTLTGTFTGNDEDERSTYNINESYNSSAIPPSRFEVTLSSDGMTLLGVQQESTVSEGVAPDSSRSPVIIRRGSSAEIMQLYPLHEELEENKPAALWRFAISAALQDVRRERFSWAFMKERRDRKHLLASFLLAQSLHHTICPDDTQDFARLMDLTPPADFHYFSWASIEPERFSRVCDVQRANYTTAQQSVTNSVKVEEAEEAALRLHYVIAWNAWRTIWTTGSTSF
ncbi:hypothetical protein C8Q77DRAFT_1161714 [Trametes polyzona]|nr:hypothetical protein C8Q77DRAFT_1161714 [Trametes polyzona]